MAAETIEILDLDGVNRALTRIAHEILEKNAGVEDLLLIGIRTGGAYLATQLQQKINEIEGATVSLGIIDVTMYRDAVKTTGYEDKLAVKDLIEVVHEAVVAQDL